MFNEDELYSMKSALGLMLDDDDNRAGLTKAQIYHAHNAARGIEAILNGDTVQDSWSLEDITGNMDEDSVELTVEEQRAILADFGDRDRSDENEALADQIRDVQSDKLTTIAARLEELRVELQAERISTGELVELQGLAKYIDEGDVELLEAAGVPEHPEA